MHGRERDPGKPGVSGRPAAGQDDQREERDAPSKHIVLGAGRRGRRWPPRRAAGAGAGHRSTCRCSPIAPARSPAPASRSPTACTTISPCSTSATAASAASSSSIEECETGYDTKKGVECYEPVKGKNPVVINPYSTGITLQLIPKASVDKIPILSMAYGLSASAVGNIFPWIFNPPATYWDGASAFIKYIGEQGRRPRQAQGQEDRLHLSRRAATARSRSRCSSSSPRTTASS